MNVFTASGNLGKDCRTGNANGTPYIGFSLPVKSGYGDKEQTNWLDCTIWGKRAEGRLAEFLTKGTPVVVTGELGTREYEGKTYLTLRVADLDLIGGRDDKPSASAPADSGVPYDDVPF